MVPTKAAGCTILLLFRKAPGAFVLSRKITACMVQITVLQKSEKHKAQQYKIMWDTQWHLDEVFIAIGGKRHSLWRAVDQNGIVLDILVQSRRNTKAAKRFFCKLLKELQYVPRVIITDKLASYGLAKKEIMPSVEHRQHKGLNNEGENTHQPTRQRERTMRRFKSPRHARRFLSAYLPTAPLFSFSRPSFLGRSLVLTLS